MRDPKPTAFEIHVGTSAEGEPISEQPFRIAWFGNFGGHSKPVTPIQLDRDNFDAVLKRCAPSLELSFAGSSVRLTFESLDDFHPDSLSRLLTAPLPPRDPDASTAGPLLDQMVDAAEPTAPRKTSSRPGDLQAFLDRATAGHLVPKPDARELDRQARTESVLAGQLRSLLHHPDFQALESAWRSAFFLTRRLETSTTLQLFLFDISKKELQDDLLAATNLRATDFFRNAQGLPGGGRWAVMGADYSFTTAPEDIALLSRIALIASQHATPFLSATPDPGERPRDSVAAQYWQALRVLPESVYIGLAAPRFLLRLPYGKETNPIERLPFEEMPAAPDARGYLWGNPAIVCLCLLGQTFAQDGWKMRPGTIREISGLPLHIFRQNGEPSMQPCTEALVTDREAEIVLQQGVMPLLADRNGDRILLPRFQSVAHPPRALAGPW